MTRWLAALVLVVACGSGREEVLVSAAASLTDAFREIEAAFEAANPDVDVVLNLGASSTLRDQILEGAPTDVFAAADTATMDAVAAAGDTAGEPVVFATNRMMIAVPSGNPAGVTGLDDFADPGLFIGLCAEGVPCGDFAAVVLANAGMEPSVDTREPNVRALLAKIEVGEIDAGIVYATDVAAASGVEGIDLDPAVNVVAAYPIAVLAGATHPDATADFVGFVLSPEGREILLGYGFGAP